MKVNLKGYFAPEEETQQKKKERAERIKTEGSKFFRETADKIKGVGEVFVDHSEEACEPI